MNQERVARARAVKATRFAGTALLTNADMGPMELCQHAALGDPRDAAEDRGQADGVLGTCWRPIHCSHPGIQARRLPWVPG